MIKLPEGIRFTAEDFDGKILDLDFDGDAKFILCNRDAECIAEIANSKLAALFEAWVRQEGVKVFGFSTIGSRGSEMNGDRWLFDTDHGNKDTHQAYLVLCQEIKK